MPVVPQSVEREGVSFADESACPNLRDGETQGRQGTQNDNSPADAPVDNPPANAPVDNSPADAPGAYETSEKPGKDQPETDIKKDLPDLRKD